MSKSLFTARIEQAARAIQQKKSKGQRREGPRLEHPASTDLHAECLMVSGRASPMALTWINRRAQDGSTTMDTGYRDLAEYYSLLFPLNGRQRDFFERLLQDGPAGSILDVGCGTGEHLSWFSARNFRAYGLEPDAGMFRELERRRWPGPAPTLVPGGVELLPSAIGESVDLVLCLGNTLPHLPDRAAVQRAVRAMTATLSPRGRLVLQTVNFDRVLDEGRAAFPVIERVLPDGGRIAFFREYDREALPGRLLFKTRLVTPVGEHQAAWPLLPLRREDIARCVDDAGLDDTLVLGDYDQSPFSETSPALIVVGGRRLSPGEAAPPATPTAASGAPAAVGA